MDDSYLRAQLAAHPSMRPQDAIKFFFQAHFGAEHLLTDPQDARDDFVREWNGTPPTNEPLTEALSDRAARVNLGAWKAAGLAPEWLFSLFYQSARTMSEKDEDAFFRDLDDMSELVKSGAFAFDADAWQKALSSYRKAGAHAVHHSDFYRDHESPAYRVLSSRAARLVPVLQALPPLPQKDEPVVIALDGRAASGKSTAAAILSEALGAGVVAMDDFFLPPELRTPERLAQPGGNVDYDRFAREVLPHLYKADAFAYRAFDCGEMKLGGEVVVPAGNLRIVEGSYSHHPRFGDYAALRIFFDLSPEEQAMRILKRNGEEMAQMFQTRWIPMEEAYFDAFAVREHADLIIR